VLPLRRVQWLVAILLGSGVFFFASRASALPEKDIRTLVNKAVEHEKSANWEDARQIYEKLLGQNDPGLRIRERYQNALRRCWQTRRHNDTSFRQEVLALDYGQAMRICGIINDTLLDGSVDKKKVDSTKLFKKGLEELDAALADVKFVQQYIPASNHANIGAFRASLKKAMNEVGGLSRKNALKRIGEIALGAEFELGLDPTVTVMEIASGACYAIDDYTVYLTPNQFFVLAQSISQTEATSVGLRLAVQGNKIVIRALTMESPAIDKLMENDEIISIDKQPVANLNLDQVRKLLYGPAGSMVDIEILRPGDESTQNFPLQRQAVLASVNFFQLPSTPYSYLKISSFTDSTLQDIDQALKNPGMKGLVLDLRQNGGGIVDSAIDTARRFLTTGVIASSVNQDTKQNRVYHAKNPDALAVPLIVLVDNDTASAAEILAGALKENNRAILIGQTTFGKGCTQCVLKLPNGTGGMRLTVARFFSPKGQPYSGRGVVPHIFIDERMAASQTTAMSDPFVDRAIDELNRMLAMPK